MPAPRKTREREFEDLLIEVLSQDYDLAVRHKSQKLDRRSRATAVLGFDYHYTGSGEAKVNVTVKGAPDFANVLPVDFSSAEGIQRSAEDCEALALFLMEHLAEEREALIDAIESGELEYGRREEDLY